MHQALDTLETPEKILELTASVSAFLERYGTRELMGAQWEGPLSRVQPENRFEALMAACGCSGDPGLFFSGIAGKIRQRLASRGAVRQSAVTLGGQTLPRLVLYHILETAWPGQALCSVKTPEKLLERTGAEVRDATAMTRVLDTYPVRLSAHVIRQSLVSGAVAAQYLPFEDELDPLGHELTFDGHFKQGLMEQMYRNRAIFLLDMRCPVFCRFCFRKHKSLRKEPSPGIGDVRSALSRVAQTPEIREILITGGEPLLNRRNLTAAVDGLLKIDHVEALRLATRSLAYYPHLFTHHGGEVLAYLKSVHHRCRSLGKRLEIGIHMVHPDELSIQTLKIIADLTASGIPVYVQTPFLRDVNHEGPVLGELFAQLRQAGARIYYIFTPCHPIHGTRKYWSPISLSFEAYHWLRGQVSDRCLPKLCTATPLGKMEWHTSGWAVAKDSCDPDHIWIRTPYTRDYFRPLTGDAPLPVETRKNSGGTLDVKCLVDMGDASLFLGEDGPGGKKPERGRPPGEHQEAVPVPPVEEIQARFYDKTPVMVSGSKTGVQGLDRLHRTRAALTLDPGGAPPGTAYLADHPEITDLILRVPQGFSEDPEKEADAVAAAVGCFAALGRYLCIRLAWARVQVAPDSILPEHVERLRSLARFDPACPFRLEFETWWLSADQITGAHCILMASLTDAGMGVYANTALIQGVNTAPARALALARAVRRAGMEFHHVYTGGLELQKALNRIDPLPMNEVVALASGIRMNCTGREVPLYVNWTWSGERDFGLPG